MVKRCEVSRRAISLAVLLTILLVPFPASARSGITDSSRQQAGRPPLEQRLDKRDGGGWLRFVPPVVRRFVVRVQEEITVPKP